MKLAPVPAFIIQSDTLRDLNFTAISWRIDSGGPILENIAVAVEVPQKNGSSRACGPQSGGVFGPLRCGANQEREG